MKKLLYIWTILSCTPLFAAAGIISLENDRIAATFDAKSGALVGLVNKASGWKIMDRAVLGQSFELLLPLEGKEMTEQDYRFNVVKGIEQQAPVVERSGDRIVFTWSNLKSPPPGGACRCHFPRGGPADRHGARIRRRADQ